MLLPEAQDRPTAEQVAAKADALLLGTTLDAHLHVFFFVEFTCLSLVCVLPCLQRWRG